MPRRHIPWIAIRIDMPESAKLTDLPNDSARWGWLTVLTKAKTQKRMGVFESERHWRAVMVGYTRYLPAYLAAGLLERSGSLCGRCSKDHGDMREGAIVVHDFLREQRDPTASTRQARFRVAHEGDGDSNGESDDEINVDPTVDSRALSLSLSREDQETGERGRGSGGNQRPAADLSERDRIQAAMYDASGLYFPIPSRNGDRLEVMAKRVGIDRLVETIASASEDMGPYADQAALVNTVANYLSTPLSAKRETSTEREDRERRERAAALNAQYSGSR